MVLIKLFVEFRELWLVQSNLHRLLIVWNHWTGVLFLLFLCFWFCGIFNSLSRLGCTFLWTNFFLFSCFRLQWLWFVVRRLDYYFNLLRLLHRFLRFLFFLDRKLPVRHLQIRCYFLQMSQWTWIGCFILVSGFLLELNLKLFEIIHHLKMFLDVCHFNGSHLSLIVSDA